MDLVLMVKPTQVTLVPDAPDVLTSNAGWNTQANFDFLSKTVDTLKAVGIRTSIFVGTDLTMIEYAAKTGTDRIELYTEPYACGYEADAAQAVAPFVEASTLAHNLGMGVNAGHDLNLENLKFFHEKVPYLNEVSIGHSLIADALYMGLKTTIARYKECLI